MPVFLSFLICTLGGGVCRTVVPTERPFIGISACQMEGMMTTPQWQEQHPGWRIKRIRCSIGNPRSLMRRFEILRHRAGRLWFASGAQCGGERSYALTVLAASRTPGVTVS